MPEIPGLHPRIWKFRWSFKKNLTKIARIITLMSKRYYIRNQDHNQNWVVKSEKVLPVPASKHLGPYVYNYHYSPSKQAELQSLCSGVCQYPPVKWSIAKAIYVSTDQSVKSGPIDHIYRNSATFSIRNIAFKLDILRFVDILWNNPVNPLTERSKPAKSFQIHD